MSWTNVSYYGSDDWHFESPYIDRGKLHINFVKVSLKASVKWKDDNNIGSGFGIASITDTFAKSVPLAINWDQQSHGYGKSQSFEVVVPVTDLEDQKPTTLYLDLYAFVNGASTSIPITIHATW